MNILKKLISIILSLALSVSLIYFVIINSASTNTMSDDTDSAQGQEKIQTLANTDFASVQKSIDILKVKHAPATASIAVNPSDFKNIFKDDVFLGDSQTEALSAYDILSETSVVAKKGKTTTLALGDVQTVKNLNPKRVFILFGLNDLENFDDLNQFMDSYKKLLDSLHQNIPNAKLYVNSVLPARSDIEASNKSLTADRINNSNKMIMQLCKDENAQYIDISYILIDNPNLFEPDGQHPQFSFYKVWLSKLATL